MMNSLKLLIILPVLFVSAACLLSKKQEPRHITLVNGRWETSYNCPEWRTGQPLNCDGLDRQAEGKCDCGGSYYEQITEAANYPDGGGGKGQRHWVSCSGNNHSGGLLLKFPKPYSREFWIRWYFRFEKGFPAFVENKMFYIYLSPHSENGVFNLPWQNNTIRFYEQTGGHKNLSSKVGWDYLYGPGQPADGSWHKGVLHLKLESDSLDNGIFRMWLDDSLVIDRPDANYTGGDSVSGFWQIILGSNSVNGHGGERCFYYDLDDIAISTNTHESNPF